MQVPIRITEYSERFGEREQYGVVLSINVDVRQMPHLRRFSILLKYKIILYYYNLLRVSMHVYTPICKLYVKNC